MLNKGAVWTYWEGRVPRHRPRRGRDDGPADRDKKGWFWYIPLHDNIVSVGVVAPFDYLFKDRRGSHEQTYDEEVDRCPAVKDALERAKRVTGYFVTRDYSYRVEDRSRATAGCSSAMLSGSSIRCIPRASSWH